MKKLFIIAFKETFLSRYHKYSFKNKSNLLWAVTNNGITPLSILYITIIFLCKPCFVHENIGAFFSKILQSCKMPAKLNTKNGSVQG